MAEHEYKHLFGPVPSRRLGRSLGVDLVPFKTCSYDCVYCQLGLTTNKTIERKEYIALDEVLDEIQRRCAEGLRADYITLSGSGEPTLYSRLKELVIGIKAITDIPLAVITNSSLLWDPEVQEALLPVDLVVPSLDAGNQELFEYVNRPHASVTYEKMLNGLITFSQKFKNTLWLEVLLLGGVTGTPEHVALIAEQVKKIKLDKVQLNTVVRPPAETYASGMTKDELKQFVPMFGKNTEMIADFSHVHDQIQFTVAREDVLNLLRRRPCTLTDVSEGLGIHPNEAIKHLDQLVELGDIVTEQRGDNTFYAVK